MDVYYGVFWHTITFRVIAIVFKNINARITRKISIGYEQHFVILALISSLSTMLLPEDITLYYNVCIARTLVSPTKGWLSLVSLDLSGCNFNEKILVEKIRQGSKSGKAT